KSVGKRLLNASQPLNETTDAPIAAYHTLNLREIYEQDEC
ncbi:hypothetical protein Godav_004242, partial [Gossypium davidsonii]|nr:hypothetical protein [Gossypium davidsonii]